MKKKWGQCSKWYSRKWRESGALGASIRLGTIVLFPIWGPLCAIGCLLWVLFLWWELIVMWIWEGK